MGFGEGVWGHGPAWIKRLLVTQTPANVRPMHPSLDGWRAVANGGPAAPLRGQRRPCAALSTATPAPAGRGCGPRTARRAGARAGGWGGGRGGPAAPWGGGGGRGRKGSGGFRGITGRVWRTLLGPSAQLFQVVPGGSSELAAGRGRAAQTRSGVKGRGAPAAPAKSEGPPISPARPLARLHRDACARVPVQAARHHVNDVGVGAGRVPGAGGFVWFGLVWVWPGLEWVIGLDWIEGFAEQTSLPAAGLLDALQLLVMQVCKHGERRAWEVGVRARRQV